MDAPSHAERRKPENNSLSLLVDRVIYLLDYSGESEARFLLAANQVPASVGARVLFDPGHWRVKAPWQDEVTSQRPQALCENSRASRKTKKDYRPKRVIL